MTNEFSMECLDASNEYLGVASTIEIMEEDDDCEIIEEKVKELVTLIKQGEPLSLSESEATVLLIDANDAMDFEVSSTEDISVRNYPLNDNDKIPEIAKKSLIEGNTNGALVLIKIWSGQNRGQNNHVNLNATENINENVETVKIIVGNSQNINCTNQEVNNNNVLENINKINLEEFDFGVLTDNCLSNNTGTFDSNNNTQPLANVKYDNFKNREKNITNDTEDEAIFNVKQNKNRLRKGNNQKRNSQLPKYIAKENNIFDPQKAVEHFQDKCDLGDLLEAERRVLLQPLDALCHIDEDGDTPLMILACRKLEQKSRFFENLFALQECIQDIKICCETPMAYYEEFCTVCGKQTKQDLCSPLSFKNKQGDSALTCAIKMRQPEIVIDYLLAGLFRNSYDIQNVFDEICIQICREQLRYYPNLLRFLDQEI